MSMLAYPVRLLLRRPRPSCWLSESELTVQILRRIVLAVSLSTDAAYSLNLSKESSYWAIWARCLETNISMNAPFHGYQMSRWCCLFYPQRNYIRRTSADPGYAGICLFPEETNTGTFPCKLGEYQNWDSKVWPWVLRESKSRETKLARLLSINQKLHICPIVTEDAPYWKTTQMSR
jgi:hypothetical protein